MTRLLRSRVMAALLTSSSVLNIARSMFEMALSVAVRMLVVDVGVWLAMTCSTLRLLR